MLNFRLVTQGVKMLIKDLPKHINDKCQESFGKADWLACWGNLKVQYAIDVFSKDMYDDISQSNIAIILKQEVTK